MTENGKKFFEQVSKDAALQAELQKANITALGALLKDKGLEDAAAKAGTEAMLKVASAHGFKLTAEDLKPAKLETLSEDEMKAVAGGFSMWFRYFLAPRSNGWQPDSFSEPLVQFPIV